MKKIISALLTLCLVCTLLPCTFAAETTSEKSGVKIVYDMCGTISDLGMMALGAEFDLKTVDYNSTNGFFKFVQGTDGTHYDTSGNYLGGNNGSLAYYIQRGAARKPCFAFGGNTKIAFELNVPKAGVYSFNVDYYPDNTAEIANSSVYIYLSDNGVSTASDCLIGQYKCYDANAASDEGIVTYSIPNIEIEKAGNYTVTFTTDQANRWYRNNFCNLALDGGSNLIPMISTCTIADGELEVGEEAKITTEAKKLSDGSDATGVTYSYKSENSDVADVDETGNVTAKSVGNTEITVGATYNGETAYKVIPVSVIPGNAAGIDLTYKFTGSTHAITWKETSPGFAKLTYDVGKDLNQYYTNNMNVTGHTDSQEFRGFGHEGFGMDCAKSGSWYAATIRIPVSGKYMASVESTKYNQGSVLGVYLIKNDRNLSVDELNAEISSSTLVGSHNCRDSSYPSLVWLETPIKLNTIDVEAGEYYLVFKNIAGSSYAWFGDFHLDGFGNGTAPIITECKAEKTTFEIDESAIIETAVRYITDGNAAEGVVYTYESSDKEVAEVSTDGTITAKAAGDATITVTATATNATLSGTRTIDITVNESTILPKEEEITDTIVRFNASAYAGGTVSSDDIQAVTIGTDVTVTATADDGYTFAYWKNSAGVVLSTKKTETFKVNTNTAVIAVFDKDVAEGENIPVYFYNGNGASLGNASVEKNTTFEAAKTAAGVPAIPTLTGFVFSHWSDKDSEVAIDDSALITALTRAVAIYTDDATKTYTVKNGDATVASGKKYGESVTVNGSDNFSCWKLGDKVISYEKDYTFNVYGDITLTEVTEGTMDTAPVLVLDKVDGNYFLTYDEGNYELIEAGILFGSENVSIASFDGYKAAAKKGTGQFTALPHEGATSSTIARGYMICKSGDEFKVIYAD